MWQGYATQHLNIKLKPFQVKAMEAYHNMRDSIVIQATGSGKSVCFSLPALQLNENQQGLVIVPTIALGEDHQQHMEQLGVSSVFINASSNEQDYARALDIRHPAQQRASIIILTPEFLFGKPPQKGVLHDLQKDQLAFVVVDEAHLMFDWVTFRESFNQLKTLKSMVLCPIMALSATMKPSNVLVMKRDVLRNPVLLKGKIDRPNVAIHVLPYRVSSEAEMAKHGGSEFFAVAKQIKSTVENETTVVYLAYAAHCEKLSKDLSALGIKTGTYTGKNSSNREKREVYRDFKTGSIQILVATKAFGMGINLENIRHVINIGNYGLTVHCLTTISTKFIIFLFL